MRIPTDPFRDFPDNARIWVIAADRDLDASERQAIFSRLTSFFEAWSSHGRKVVADCTIQRDRFIIVGAYVPGNDVSGCGIDASVKELDAIAEETGFARAPILDVFFAGEQGVSQVDRATFASLARGGSVGSETMIFDTSIAEAADWKQGRFERPISESWHADVFF